MDLMDDRMGYVDMCARGRDMDMSMQDQVVGKNPTSRIWDALRGGLQWCILANGRSDSPAWYAGPSLRALARLHDLQLCQAQLVDSTLTRDSVICCGHLVALIVVVNFIRGPQPL